MRLDKSHTFLSKHHDIKLVATELEEPNYGRFRWKYQFLVDDNLVENKYMNYTYGGLVSNLVNFSMESETGEYIYIPLDKNALIFEPKKEEYFIIPSVGEGRNNGYLKNVFQDKKMIILYERSIQVINLPTKTTQTVVFSLKDYQLKDVSYADGIQVTYINLKNSKEYTKYYDFESMEFKNKKHE